MEDLNSSNDMSRCDDQNEMTESKRKSMILDEQKSPLFKQLSQLKPLKSYATTTSICLSVNVNGASVGSDGAHTFIVQVSFQPHLSSTSVTLHPSIKYT